MPPSTAPGAGHCLGFTVPLAVTQSLAMGTLDHLINIGGYRVGDAPDADTLGEFSPLKCYFDGPSGFSLSVGKTVDLGYGGASADGNGC